MAGRDTIARTSARQAFTLARDLSSAVENKNFRYTPSLSSGTLLHFGPGQLRKTDGTYLIFDGGSVKVPSNINCDIVLDLYDNKLHALPRSLHRGAVHIAHVETESGEVINVKQPDLFSIPTSRIEKTKRKIKRTGQIVRIGLIGDSLTQGAGELPYWRSLIFDPAQSAGGFNLSRLVDVTVDNYAVGSQTSRYGFAVSGRKVYTNNAQFDNTAVTLADYTSSNFYNPPRAALASPINTTQYDLAVVSFGANGGTNYLAYLENIIKELRLNGTEVIITSSNYGRDTPIFLYDDTNLMRQIADVWGCEFADTWSYVKEAEWNGDVVHSDSIHMSAKGHKAWARSIRSVLNDIDQESENLNASNETRFMTQLSSGLYTKFPNACEIVYDPFAKTSTTVSGTVTSSFFNPAILFGGKDSTNYIQNLEVGQHAQYGHAHAHAVDILFDYSSAFTANITRNGDAIPVKTVSFSGTHASRVGLIEVAELGVWGDATTGKPGYRNGGIKIACTSGLMKIVGVVFHTWKNNEIRLKDIDFTGSWSEEAWIWNVPVTKYSDTDGDSLSFEFIGTGAQLLFSNRNSAGKIDVYLDGVKVIAGRDLYNASNGVASVDLFPFASQDRFNIGYGKHYVKVVLNGVNTGAVTPTATNRRLQFLGGYVFDSR